MKHKISLRAALVALLLILCIALLASCLPSQPDGSGDTDADNGGSSNDGSGDNGGSTDGDGTSGGEDTGSDNSDGNITPEPQPKPEPEPKPEPKPFISDYTVVLAGNSSGNVVSHSQSMALSVKDMLGKPLDIKYESYDDEEYPILIGATEKPHTAQALEKLNAQLGGTDGYIIDVTNTSIAVVGTCDNATLRAVKVFREKYLEASRDSAELNTDAGLTLICAYNSNAVDIIGGGTEIEQLQSATTVFAPGTYEADVWGEPIKSGSSHYPSIIVLQHQPNEEDNGKLIAHFCLADSYKKTTDACFMESADGGETWKILSRPEEQKSPGLVPGRMAHLYELPHDLGEYPRGTLVFSSGSIDYSVRSEIWIWYSTDCGKTWVQESLVATGGITREGVWEPFTFYEDGWLYCFYSDDSDPAHDQKLVYKRSQDGKTWSELVDVCTFPTAKDRPGMIIITKMGNGEFFMVYEYYGTGGGNVYYKKTRDLANWDPESPGRELECNGYRVKGAPSCIWVPAGGECGMLIATGKTEIGGDGTHRIFVSFDYGESWTTMKNPLPYTDGTDGTTTRIGHSPSFAISADGHTVYYLNTTNVPETGKRRIQFASFLVY